MISDSVYLISNMHPIQEKILKLMDRQDVSKLTLRAIGSLVGEENKPQKVKHHLSQLAKKGLIRLDKDKNIIEQVKSGKMKVGGLVAVPILGSANCGQALCFGEQRFEGHLYISSRLLKKVKNIFAVKAVGPSMTKAKIGGQSSSTDGDYVLVEKDCGALKNGDYVLSVIDGLTNIKKFFRDQENHQIVLVSESTQDYPPIYIHEDDFTDYFINGKVVQVLKRPKTDQEFWQETSGLDVLKETGPISKEDYNYYNNLCSKKEE